MKFCLLPLCLFCYGNVAAQHFVTRIGLGSGATFERKYPDCTTIGNKGRLMGSLGLFYRNSKKMSWGIEGITSGKLPLYTGDSGPCQIEDLSTNTLTLNSNNLNASSLLIRSRLQFAGVKTFYVDMGAGITTYYYNDAVKDKKARKISPVLSPEIGYKFSKFELNCMMILGGRTPALEGYDPFRGMNISLKSIRSQQLYVRVQYDLFRF